MKRTVLLLLTAVALIASGCGNSEENDYIKQVNAADAKAQAALSDLGKKVTTAKAAAVSFDDAADRLEPVVKEYEAIDPPSNAEKAHATTIAGMTGLVALLRSIADDYRSANTQAEVDALEKQARNITSERPFRLLEQARRELADAGYKVAEPATTAP